MSLIWYFTQGSSLESGLLPAKAQARMAEAVPTVYGDGVQEADHADGAGEFLLEGFQLV